MKRTITIADYVGAPTIEAECDDRGWNGFHVPHLTAEEMHEHMRAVVENAPEGTWWGEVTVERVGDVIRMTTEDAVDPESRVDEWQVDESGRAWIDGLVWQTPWADDDSDIAEHVVAPDEREPEEMVRVTFDEAGREITLDDDVTYGVDAHCVAPGCGWTHTASVRSLDPQSIAAAMDDMTALHRRTRAGV